MWTHVGLGTTPTSHNPVTLFLFSPACSVLEPLARPIFSANRISAPALRVTARSRERLVRPAPAFLFHCEQEGQVCFARFSSDF